MLLQLSEMGERLWSMSGLCHRGIWISPPWNIPRTFAPPGQFHRPLHGVGHFPFHHHRLSIYNMKRSNVKVYEIHSGDRLGSGVRVSASFQIVALTAGGTP